MPLQLGALDELNARPLWFCLQDHAEVELRRDTRGGVSVALERGDVDLSVVAVVKAAEMGWFRVPGVGISVAGALDSVFLFSNAPREEVTVIYGTDDSRSSTMLLKVLLRRSGIELPFHMLPSREARARAQAEPRAATLLIGDQAMKAVGAFAHAWDLPKAWHALTGLPMVAAVWGSKAPVSPEIASLLQQAAEDGEASRAEIARQVVNEGWIDEASAARYLCRLRYRLGAAEEAGISLFLTLLSHYGLIEVRGGGFTIDPQSAHMASWFEGSDAARREQP